MRLYELIQQISDIITPETNSFYNYALYTSDDDGGFLRTRYCWSLKPVGDHEIGNDFSKVIVASQKEINIKHLEDNTQISEFTGKNKTLVKLQIHYDFKKATWRDADWDIQMDYSYIYIFDLNKKKYNMKHFVFDIKSGKYIEKKESD